MAVRHTNAKCATSYSSKYIYSMLTCLVISRIQCRFQVATSMCGLNIQKRGSDFTQRKGSGRRRCRIMVRVTVATASDRIKSPTSLMCRFKRRTETENTWMAVEMWTLCSLSGHESDNKMAVSLESSNLRVQWPLKPKSLKTLRPLK